MTQPLPLAGPQVGDVVLMVVHPALNGGSPVAPALVTRSHGLVCGRPAGQPAWLCNVRVLLDTRPSFRLDDEWIQRVEVVSSQAEAEQLASSGSRPVGYIRSGVAA